MQQHLAMILAMGCAQALIRVYGLLPGASAIALLLLLIMPLWLLYISVSPRQLQRVSDKQTKNVYLGQPQLLPTLVSHTRLGTGQYNYTVPHFMVGTPVGLHGCIGSLLSLDEPENSSSSSSRIQTAGLMQYLSPNLKSWFTVHAHHHLHKGNDTIGLQGKLHTFLVSQGENPDEWPYAYLVTMPQFLGYQRNLVCFWYLYSAERELTAMIMEVNNYWGQRKLAFSRLTGEAPLHPSRIPSTPTEIPTGQPSCQFFHSNPRHITYRGTWDKDMFISPFEKVEGSIALRFSDPLALDTPLQITITLLSPSGKPRLIGRVFSPEEHEPLYPLTASSWSLLRFLPYWTGVLVVTELLIIGAALRIHSKGAISFFSMPEVRPNNFPRDETDIERSLEPTFRGYLKHIVESSPSPISLTYLPSKSHYLKPDTFTSSSVPYTDGKPQSLTLQVLSPQFYTSFPLHKDASTAFTTESRPTQLPSDPSSRSLLISHPEVFFPLVKEGESTHLSTPRPKTHSSLLNSLTTYLRPQSQPDQDSTREGMKEQGGEYFLDTFASTLSSPEQKVYYTGLAKHLLALKIAFGFHPLLNLYELLGRLVLDAGVSWGLLEMAWGFLKGVRM
ncbi:hypothetical protein BJY04DRAFT_212716 [Aspergillus karnatakaensis]|uniref:uncharacterized protein n=1 Tax=Aspergillus karnatakaensis TaxID=1810916 RepID=UPI003CCCBD5D